MRVTISIDLDGENEPHAGVTFVSDRPRRLSDIGQDTEAEAGRAAVALTQLSMDGLRWLEQRVPDGPEDEETAEDKQPPLDIHECPKCKPVALQITDLIYHCPSCGKGFMGVAEGTPEPLQPFGEFVPVSFQQPCTSNISEHGDAFAPSPCIRQGHHETHQGADGQIWLSVPKKATGGLISSDRMRLIGEQFFPAGTFIKTQPAGSYEAPPRNDESTIMLEGANPPIMLDWGKGAMPFRDGEDTP